MRYKFILVILIAFIPHLLLAKGKKINKIVIDAGHGGTDPGAEGAFSKEKDITLAVTLKLGRILSDSIKDLKVIYTRTTDTYPQLKDRHQLANESNADLFIAIHVNSTPFTKTRVLKGYKTIRRHHKTVKQPIYSYVVHHETTRSGVETYVLGLPRTGQQNKAIDEFSDSVTNGLLNPDDPQTQIIIEQYSQAFLRKSVALGSKIQTAFGDEGRPDLGVKQMDLEVLAGSAMPGVLVEIGFITNRNEEEYLNSEKGQHEVAMAIYRGIKAYKADIEK